MHLLSRRAHQAGVMSVMLWRAASEPKQSRKHHGKEGFANCGVDSVERSLFTCKLPLILVLWVCAGLAYSSADIMLSSCCVPLCRFGIGRCSVSSLRDFLCIQDPDRGLQATPAIPCMVKALVSRLIWLSTRKIVPISSYVIAVQVHNW